ncbi:recombinase family protein, partial [Bacteroidota bacterium]
SLDRPELERLDKIIEEKPDYFSCIYTSEISRIGRNPKQTRSIIDKWTDLGVPLYIQSLSQSTIGKDGKRNTNMSIILQVLIEYADLEAEIFKTRSKSGLLNSAKNGKAGGGLYLPYGYKKNRLKMLVVDSKESVIIKDIFKLYKEGNGIKAISNILNEKNVPTRTNISYGNKKINFKIPKLGSEVRWSDKQIHDILQNPIYKGDRRFKEHLLSAPAIIDKELFDNCNELLKNKRTRNITSVYTYLLKDIMICGRCGRNYFGRFKPIQNGDKVYICSSKLKKGESCGNCGVNIKLIESVIYNELIHSDLVVKYVDSVRSIRSELESKIVKLRRQIKIDESNLNGKKEEVERLLIRYTKGGVDDELFEKFEAKIKIEEESLKKKIRLAKKELRSNVKTLEGFDISETTKQMMLKAKFDRNELQLIFQQLFTKLIINQLDANTVLVTAFFKVNEEELAFPAKYLLDIGGIRKKTKEYRYMGMYKMDNEPTFQDNILVDDVSPIKKEFLNYKNQIISKIVGGELHDVAERPLESLQWEYIDDKYLLDMIS